MPQARATQTARNSGHRAKKWHFGLRNLRHMAMVCVAASFHEVESSELLAERGVLRAKFNGVAPVELGTRIQGGVAPL